MLLSIVFSFRNEELNLVELMRRIDGAVKTIDSVQYEGIFVNDDSTDRSLEILMELRQRYPIKIINMSRRFGVTPCIIAGLTHARGDAVVCIDNDLQDPPELIPELVERFRAGADVVHTTRTHRDGESALKMWVTRQAYRIIGLFSEIKLPENTGDFKLLSRRALRDVLNMSEYDPYLRGLSVWVGYRQDYVYYRRERRFAGKTQFPLFGTGPIEEFIRGLTSFSAAPLLLSFCLGLIACLFAVVLVIYAFYTKFMGIAAPGASGVLIAMAFFSGAMLLSNGLMGLYIARIYYQVKGRPRYIIRDVIEQDAPHPPS